MRRVSEKVKDIVEVRAFSQIHDFAADLQSTVEAYRFTDITAGLMAKWTDALASVRPGQGQALALAGLRGVGKSHFLAYLAAIASQPELRASIPDSHVQKSAEQLSRRAGKVVIVRRGTSDTLLTEVKRAIAETFGRPINELSDSVNELLLTVFERGGETPLMLFDTAAGREERVSRDDGPVLSQVAEAARAMGLFVGVALDDDISGADGANSSIVSNFSIDYLDQEHLYKIVDNHIFAKRLQKLPLLHEIYEEYRGDIPGFRWSEQRFSSLYPLHPETLEIAPLVRLYIQDFSLLGFAADAGVKILSRPANSLIGLDELFDNVEPRLRAAAELNEVFAAFDHLEQEVIAKGPVKQRHIAKLALKGLFLLSLNGQGVSATDIAAAMMIVPGEGTGAEEIDSILAGFNEAMPEAVAMAAAQSGASKYSLELGAKDDLREALAVMAAEVDEATLWQVLLRQTAERFSDLEMSDDFGSEPTVCSLEWRGSIRRGEIIWNHDISKLPRPSTDWRIAVVSPTEAVEPAAEEQLFIWRTAAPTPEEADILRSYHLLHSRPELRENFAAAWPTAAHAHSISVERIWTRLFLDGAVLVTPYATKSFSGEERPAYSLSHLLSVMLADSFDSAYPAHPAFAGVLDTKHVSALIANFFGSADVAGEEVQRAAAAFAVPLGLAEPSEKGLVPARLEVLLAAEMLQSLLAAAAGRGKDVLSLADAGERLRASPFGLTREAQQLVLAALVGQRQFDFVTAGGDRINHRSLDLQIIWDDIVGIALPLEQAFSQERLLAWARLVTGNSSLASIESSAERELITDSLSRWLDGWRAASASIDIDSLPDECLNTSIWRLATNVRRSFGAMADIIADPNRDERRLDDCLQRIAELFADSEADLEARKVEMRQLTTMITAARKNAARREYLALAGITDDPAVETLRHKLFESGSGVEGSNYDEEAWASFRSAYAEHYVLAHREQGSPAGAEDSRIVLGSQALEMFECVASLPWFSASERQRIRDLVRNARRPVCKADVGAILDAHPVCICGFRIDEHPGTPAASLRSALDASLRSFARQLAASRDQILSLVPDAGTLESLIGRIAAETAENGFAELSPADISSLRRAAEVFAAAAIDSSPANWPAHAAVDDILTFN